VTATDPDRALPNTDRLETFSDGVFAIAITLLVLEIQVPEDTAHLLEALGGLWSSYLAYVVSFLLIGLVWANHHAMFEHIKVTDRVLLFLNTLLLMNVAFLPFVAAVLAAALRTGQGQRTAVVLYGGTLVLGGVLFNAVWEYSRRGHRLLGSTIEPAEARAVAGRFLLGPLLYAVGTALGAFLPILGIAVFAGLILFYWLPVTGTTRIRRGERRG
jgi:uncharacterized membrane protein